MGSGIYVALSGAVAQGQALDVVANNVAGAGAVGFRAERVTFSSALSQAQGKDSAYVQIGPGKDDSSAGSLRQTGNPLDMALVGDGFFAVDTPRGVRYTRAGDFRLDGEGRIVNSAGLTARARGGGELRVPPGTTDLSVGEDGTISAAGEPIGALEIASFKAGSLAREGAGLWTAVGGATAQAPDQTRVVAGAVEDGNFNMVRGVIDLVKISRTYEALHRMIESYKHIDERTAREVGGPK